MTFKTLNIGALKEATLHEEPFPYLIVDNILQPAYLDQIIDDFPSIEQGGSFPLSTVPCQGYFAELMQELQTTELRDVIADRFSMDLKDKPPTITLRGYSRNQRDGQIHIDSASKLVTILIYLNKNWVDVGGKLRLLYNNHDLNNYAAEVPPEAGRCVIFKVTPNCWHGHEPFIGTRRSIQLNYVLSETAATRNLSLHRFSAWMKKLVCLGTKKVFGKKYFSAFLDYFGRFSLQK